MTQQVTVSLLDLALLAALSSLFGSAAVLALSVGIQLFRSRRDPPVPVPTNPTPPSGPGRLGDPHWGKVRNARLEIAGHRCEMCNSNSETLHAHHRTYARQGQELVEDLIMPRVIVMREPRGVPVVMAAPRAETNGTPSPGLSADDAAKMAHEQARLEEGESDGNR